VLRGASMALVILVVTGGLTYLTMIVLARWMRAEQYGIYTYVLAWSVLLAMPAAFGLHAACVRFVPEYAATGALARSAASVNSRPRSTAGPTGRP